MRLFEPAARGMEDDSVAMARQGYRVKASEEHGIPLLGITCFKVTHELVNRA